MKIKKVMVNNRKKSLEVDTSKDRFALPFLKLRLKPTPDNKIREVFVDKDLGSEAVTYILESGQEDSIHLDAFLDYNKDPDYMMKMTLYKLTVRALEIVERSGLAKREIARKLDTSAAQLYRLLDTGNYAKSIDQMIKLIVSLNYNITFKLEEEQPAELDLNQLKYRFPYLKDDEFQRTPTKSVFKPLVLT